MAVSRPTVFAGGATQELQLAGSPEHRIKSDGCWGGMVFRSYIDTQMTDALEITRLIIATVNSDSEDDTEFPIRNPQFDPLRKKLRISLSGTTSTRSQYWLRGQEAGGVQYSDLIL